MKENPDLSLEALFRHQVVSEVAGRVHAGMLVSEAITQVLATPRCDLTGKKRLLSERTIYRWRAAFAKDGVDGLEPAKRKGIKDSRALSRDMVQYLQAQKQLDPKASIPEIIRRAVICGVIASPAQACRTSVWRACKRLGLPLTRPQRKGDRDMRRFSHPHRTMMVLADGKHFRASEQRLRRVVVTFLDDATRFGLGCIVGCTENTELFLKTLHQVILHFGFLISLFVDNGPGFISSDTRTVVARLGINLIHGTPGYPQGHGKIERFHRRLSDHVLRGLDGNPAVDPDPGALTLRLSHWLANVYNHTPHAGLDGDTPAQRWEADPVQLVFPKDDSWLRHFVITCERTVSSDNVISYDGVSYEVPRGKAGKRITISRHLLAGNVLTVVHDDRQVQLSPVDLTANARARRATPPARIDTLTPCETAASAEFDADLKVLVDADGGCQKGPDDE